MRQTSPQINEQQILQAAVKFHQEGNLAQAKDLYRLILSHNPRHADAIHRLGTMALQIEQFDKAEDFIRQAIQIGPATPTMHINYGTALRNLDRYDDAIAAFDKALAQDPSNANALFNKGRSLIAAKRYTDAIETYLSILEAHPEDSESWLNLGVGYKAKGQHDEAISAFDRAAHLNPQLTEAFRNSGTVLMEKGLQEAAILMYKEAVKINPEDTGPRYFLTANLLLTGRLEEGWKDYDVRFEHFERYKNTWRPEPPPYWDGSDIKGKRFLLWTEQGLGEQILATTVLPEFSPQVADCVVEVSERFIPMFSRSFPNVTFVPYHEHNRVVNSGDRPFDFQVPALNLLGSYIKTIGDIPSREVLLKPDTALRDRLRSKYEELADGRRIVGVSWKSTSEALTAVKSSEILEWHVLFKRSDIFFVNIQYGDYEQDIRDLETQHNCRIYDDPDVKPLESLEQAAAQIAAMDLIVSVSNSNVHIGGSMGVPTWLVLPNTTSIIWYWFLERSDSPWYPSVRIFRQRSIINLEKKWWAEVLADVSEALDAWASHPLPPRMDT